MIVSEGMEPGRFDDLGQANPVIKVRLIDNLGRPLKGWRVVFFDAAFSKFVELGLDKAITDDNGYATVVVDTRRLVGNAAFLWITTYGKPQGKMSPPDVKIPDPLNPPKDLITFTFTPAPAWQGPNLPAAEQAKPPWIEEPKSPEASNTSLYIGIGAAVLAVGTLVTLYLVKK